MDEARRFRFLVPPFFLIVSVVLGAHFSGYDFRQVPKHYTTEQLVAAGAILGASALPVGFLLTSMSILVLRGVAWLLARTSYEVSVPHSWLERVWPLLRTSEPCNRKWLLHAAATFDHELLSPGIHEWIQRRWSTFNVSVHSCTAIALSHVAAASPAIRETCSWLLVSGVLLLVLGANGAVAWRQTMLMLEFQSHRDPSVFQPQSSSV